MNNRPLAPTYLRVSHESEEEASGLSLGNVVFLAEHPSPQKKKRKEVMAVNNLYCWEY